MAYRKSTRPAEVVQQWADWRRQHADLIHATGLPEHVFEPENWYFFTEHGFLMQSGADLSEMTLPQKVALLRLMMQRPIDLRSHVGHLLVLTTLDALEQALQQGYAAQDA